MTALLDSIKKLITKFIEIIKTACEKEEKSDFVDSFVLFCSTFVLDRKMYAFEVSLVDVRLRRRRSLFACLHRLFTGLCLDLSSSLKELRRFRVTVATELC